LFYCIFKVFSDILLAMLSIIARASCAAKEGMQD
jgi:hypothetical protein